MTMVLDPVRETKAMPGTHSVLSVSEAFKSFGAVQALNGASLELNRGELLGLLGPNGAGKTTLIRSITGRVVLDRGRIEIDGRELPPAERRRQLGIVPQEIALYALLTARENLEAFGQLNGVTGATLRERVARALEWTGLADRAKEPIKNFSGGMKRRLNIACGVLHEPRLILLDEPTVGVDPQSRERIYEMLATLRSAGATLLVTTHHLEEAESRCDRIAIIDHGKLIAVGTLAELIESTVGGERLVVLALDRPAAGAMSGLERGPDPRSLHARVRDIGQELPALLERVRAAGLRVEDVEVRRRGLHEVFIHLTGKDLRE
jgi:ABC-2 type transport system ATP-binding protein